jgi:hypothetical protein
VPPDRVYGRSLIRLRLAVADRLRLASSRRQLLAIAAVAWSGTRSKHRTVTAGFWFEPVSFDGSEPMADRLGGAITPREMQNIEAVAFSEITQAFSGFRVDFSTSHDATYPRGERR